MSAVLPKQSSINPPLCSRGASAVAWGRGYQGALAIERGDVVTGWRLLRGAFHEFGGFTSAMQVNAFLMVEALGRAGQMVDGLAMIERAIASSEETEGRWLTAELLRIKGELLPSRGEDGARAAAEDHFRQALDWARRQGALSWELRAATSLARLWRDQGRRAEGMALLQPVYARFTEGFGTADLKTARALLDALRSPSHDGQTRGRPSGA